MPTNDTSLRNNSAFTLMVCTCDAYEDSWEPFFTLLERYWPEAKNFPIILNTETKNYQKPGWNIQCFQLYQGRKKASYGTRMIHHLNRVKTPLVLLMLEDFFLRSPVDQCRLDGFVQAMNNNNMITCFNFSCMEQPGFPSQEYPSFQELYPICYYRLNMQAGLWRTRELRRYWKPGANPWTWETFATRKTDRTKKKFYFLQNQDSVDRIFDYGRKPGLTWGSVRGQWCRDDILPLFARERIAINFADRGWFNEHEYKENLHDTQSKLTVHQRFNIIVTELYLGGFIFSCKRISYAIVKRFFHLSDSYDEYVRTRYNPQDPPKTTEPKV